MRKKIYLVAFLSIISFLLSAPTGQGSGHTAKLMDFNLLGQGDRTENPFHIDNWILDLDGSIDYPYNRKLTYLRVAKDNSGNSSIGIRVNFPRVFVDAYARLKPVFNIPFLPRYQERGFLDNVGTIKSIKMKIRSNIYPYRIYLILTHKDGSKTKHRFNRKLDFYDWQTIEWNNPYYQENLKFDVNEKKEPLYPLIIPGVRVDSFVFERDRSIKLKSGYDSKGTDFVVYISDVVLQYDKAVNDDYYLSEENKKKPDYIDNEAIWGIETSREKNFDDNFIDDVFEKYKLDLKLRRARKGITPNATDSGAQGGNNNNQGVSGQGNNNQGVNNNPNPVSQP